MLNARGMRERLRLAALSTLLAAAGCSSADFQVAGAPSDDAALDTGGLDGGDGAVGPDGASDAPGDVVEPPGDVTVVSCPSLSDPTEVWVDAAATAGAAANGSSDCPFALVGQAVVYLASLPTKPRTIRVRAGRYLEPASVRVRSGVTLQGAGATKSIITGGGACLDSTAYQCVVGVEAGGVVDGFGVDAAPGGRHGLVTGSPGAAGNPKISNVKVYGASEDGFAGVVVTAGALLGPNLESYANRNGLIVWGSQGVAFTGGGNRLDENTDRGIEHQGSGVLSMGAASISGNGGGGVRAGQLAIGAGLVPPTHLFANMTVKNNGNYGFSLGANAGIKLRQSVVVGNPFGVIAIYGAGNTLDFGLSSTDPGNNNFGGPVAKNTRGGICVMPTRNDALPAVGNKWPACPATITQFSSGTCDAIPVTSYADVWWRGLAAPLAASCTVGS